MAGCSLTDEEKGKLEELLRDEQDNHNLQDTPQRNQSTLRFDVPDDSSDDETYFISNAYAFNDEDTSTMNDINTELEKFIVDETEKEKIDRKDSIERQMMWKDTVLMDQRLKSINAKLKDLRSICENENAKDSCLENAGSDSFASELSEEEDIEKNEVILQGNDQ